jgi:hypothetical protein
MKLRDGVWSIMPEGGDQVPSDFLAIRMPEPPEPVIHKPLRIHVKTAIPAAFCIIRLGIFLGTWSSVLMPVEVEEGDAGASLSVGAK